MRALFFKIHYSIHDVRILPLKRVHTSENRTLKKWPYLRSLSLIYWGTLTQCSSELFRIRDPGSKLQEVLPLNSKTKFLLTYFYSCYLGYMGTQSSSNQLAKRGNTTLSVVIDRGQQRKAWLLLLGHVDRGDMQRTQETLLSDRSQTFH